MMDYAGRVAQADTYPKMLRLNATEHGNEIALRPGMLVNADILLERRTLLEWLFEPVLQLRGRL